MTDDTRRVIVTKRKTYELAPEAEGVRLADLYPGAKLPKGFEDARIYQTPDGSVVARPDTDGQAG